MEQGLPSSFKKDPMYRYLEKYVRTYRVKAYYDLATEDFPRDELGNIDESFEDLYIPCYRGEIRATAIKKDKLLYWYGNRQMGKDVVQKIKENFPEMWFKEEDISSWDYLVYFRSEDIEKIASIVKPYTSGASIKPFSTKNLPHTTHKIPEEEENLLKEIGKELGALQKAQFIRNCFKTFDEVIDKKKGKGYNAKEERKKSGLTSKEFVYSIGMWKDFIKFAEKEYEDNYV